MQLDNFSFPDKKQISVIITIKKENTELFVRRNLRENFQKVDSLIEITLK